MHRISFQFVDKVKRKTFIIKIRRRRKRRDARPSLHLTALRVSEAKRIGARRECTKPFVGKTIGFSTV